MNEFSFRDPQNFLRLLAYQKLPFLPPWRLSSVRSVLLTELCMPCVVNKASILIKNHLITPNSIRITESYDTAGVAVIM